jgi:hypothetical protein
MARSYQVSCAPGTLTTIADAVTLPGGPCVTITNQHPTEVLLIGGDENQAKNIPAAAQTPLTVATGFRLPAGKTITVVLNGDEALYGRGGNTTATCSVSVLRTNGRVAGNFG